MDSNEGESNAASRSILSICQFVPLTQYPQLTLGVTKRYLPNVRLFGKESVMTNAGILHESGHDEAWIIAMDCLSTREAVLDYSFRWRLSRPFLILSEKVGSVWFRGSLVGCDI